jgi:hypothetical protein
LNVRVKANAALSQMPKCLDCYEKEVWEWMSAPCSLGAFLALFIAVKTTRRPSIVIQRSLVGVGDKDRQCMRHVSPITRDAVCVRKRGGAGGDNTVIGGWEAQRDDARSCKHCHRRRNHPRHQPLPSFLLNVMALGRPLGMQRRKTYTGEGRFPRGCLQE